MVGPWTCSRGFRRSREGSGRHERYDEDEVAHAPGRNGAKRVVSAGYGPAGGRKWAKRVVSAGYGPAGGRKWAKRVVSAGYGPAGGRKWAKRVVSAGYGPAGGRKWAKRVVSAGYGPAGGRKWAKRVVSAGYGPAGGRKWAKRVVSAGYGPRTGAAARPCPAERRLSRRSGACSERILGGGRTVTRSPMARVGSAFRENPREVVCPYGRPPVSDRGSHEYVIAHVSRGWSDDDNQLWFDRLSTSGPDGSPRRSE